MRHGIVGGIVALGLICGSVAAGPSAQAVPTPRIVGGTIIDASTVPWTAALFQHAVADPFAAHYCGGTLIDPQWVLTAGHCVEGMAATDIDVGFAKTKLSSYGPGNRRSVDRIVTHPSYDPQTLRADLALLHLTQPATGAPTVPINSSLSIPAGVQSLDVYGWGSTSGSGPNYPDDLHGVSVYSVSNTSCGQYPSGVFVVQLMLCVGVFGGGKDSCAGDSGGPLVTSGPSPVLVGIVSFGSGCALVNFPGLYTRVSAFADWIGQIVENRGPIGLWTFGANNFGSLGDGSYAPRALPLRVGPNRPHYNAVAAGNDRSCAVGDDGVLRCWGAPSGGSPFEPSYPIQRTVGAATNWTLVATSSMSTCGVRLDASLWCWGRNDRGQIGSSTYAASEFPVESQPGSRWKSVAVSNYWTCAIAASGSLFCWGVNEPQMLGDGFTLGANRPTPIMASASWKDVAVADDHGCAVRTDTTLWCWGDNVHGQLGDSTNTQRAIPTQVVGTQQWDSVATGPGTTCALETNGAVWCWGRNDNSQTGDGTTAFRRSPSLVLGPHSATKIVKSATSTAAILSDRTAVYWGTHPYSKTPVSRPTGLDSFDDVIDLAIGDDHVMVLRDPINTTRVSLGFTVTEDDRLLQMAAALGYSDLQQFEHDAVGIIAFLLGFSADPTPTPIQAPPMGLARAHTVRWSQAEIGALDTVEGRFVLNATDAHRVSLSIIDFLLALGGR